LLNCRKAPLLQSWKLLLLVWYTKLSHMQYQKVSVSVLTVNWQFDVYEEEHGTLGNCMFYNAPVSVIESILTVNICCLFSIITVHFKVQTAVAFRSIKFSFVLSWFIVKVSEKVTKVSHCNVFHC
jgi:hypothetical protein